MSHESGEGRLVRFQRGGRKGRRRVHRLSVLVHHVRVTVGSQLHPLRHIVLASVLPGSEPEQHQAQVMLASLFQHGINCRVVVLALPRFKLLPVDRHLDRIDVEVFHGGPHLWKHVQPGAGVMHLGAQHQIRSVVHEEGEASVLFHDARNWALLNLGAKSNRQTGGDDGGENCRSKFHLQESFDGILCRFRAGVQIWTRFTVTRLARTPFAPRVPGVTCFHLS